MTHNFDYDYFVIGAGSGGVRSSRIAAGLGAKVGVAEYKDIGGTCVNVGCVPKKIMTYAADYHNHFEDAKGYGWDVDVSKKFDWQRFIARKDSEIKRLNSIYDGLLEKAGVDYYHHHAGFIDEHTLQVGDEKITADKILIATGGTPRVDAIPGAEHTIVSDDLFHLEKQPEHILIIGGGYVAVEFAHVFHGLGSKVSICYRGDLFLSSFDKEIREMLRDEMIKDGVHLSFNCNIVSVEKQGETLIATMTDGTKIECDCILSAIGRIPNTQGLNLEKIGVETTSCGQVKINEHYQTNVPNIYALGDVANQWHLTPVATAEGQTLARRLFGEQKDAEVCYQNIATAIFSQPPIATTGYNEQQARDLGYDIEVFQTNFRAMKFVLAERDERIFMKLVVDKKTDKVIGCHMIGLDSPEIMQGFAVAMNAGATKGDFDRTIGIHPTAAEEFVTMK